MKKVFDILLFIDRVLVSALLIYVIICWCIRFKWQGSNIFIFSIIILIPLSFLSQYISSKNKYVKCIKRFFFFPHFSLLPIQASPIFFFFFIVHKSLLEKKNCFIIFKKNDSIYFLYILLLIMSTISLLDVMIRTHPKRIRLFKINAIRNRGKPPIRRFRGGPRSV